MAVLVTGGAGFIGSHTVVELLGAGEKVIILDNFSNSKPSVLDKIRRISGKDFGFYAVDLRDENGVKRVFDENPDIDSVIHFAALKAVGESVAKELGLDEVYTELLPADKVSQVERLLNDEGNNGKLAFVGDGINDAPVLSRADIGIAMGAMGSDAAIEAADIVLMDDDPMKIVKAIKIARKCIRIVYENIYFAIGIKVICLILGALGIANMWAAIFADVGVMVIAVLNAIRALSVKKL